jgi:signal transduction histidine kinase
MFRPMINQKKLRLCHFVNKNVPDKIFDDCKRIKQILVNLLGNAVKYTPKGVITIIVDWVEDFESCSENSSIPNSYHYLRFAVSDSGVGISKDRKKSLFKFLEPNLYKDIDHEDSLPKNQLAGTGLGISQKIAKELGSEIKFISTVNTGSKFWFEIKVDNVRDQEERKRMSSKKISTPRISFHNKMKSALKYDVSNKSNIKLMSQDDMKSIKMGSFSIGN